MPRVITAAKRMNANSLCGSTSSNISINSTSVVHVSRKHAGVVLVSFLERILQGCRFHMGVQSSDGLQDNVVMHTVSCRRLSRGIVLCVVTLCSVVGQREIVPEINYVRRCSQHISDCWVCSDRNGGWMLKSRKSKCGRFVK